MAVAELLAAALALHAAIGAAFAILFLVAGIECIDPEARGAGVGFRLIIFPGVAAFWPLLLVRWLRGAPGPPLECNPHRKAALPGDPR